MTQSGTDILAQVPDHMDHFLGNAVIPGKSCPGAAERGGVVTVPEQSAGVAASSAVVSETGRSGLGPLGEGGGGGGGVGGGGGGVRGGRNLGLFLDLAWSMADDPATGRFQSLRPDLLERFCVLADAVVSAEVAGLGAVWSPAWGSLLSSFLLWLRLRLLDLCGRDGIAVLSCPVPLPRRVLRGVEVEARVQDRQCRLRCRLARELGRPLPGRVVLVLGEEALVQVGQGHAHAHLAGVLGLPLLVLHPEVRPALHLGQPLPQEAAYLVVDDGRPDHPPALPHTLGLRQPSQLEQLGHGVGAVDADDGEVVVPAARRPDHALDPLLGLLGRDLVGPRATPLLLEGLDMLDFFWGWQEAAWTCPLAMEELGAGHGDLEA